MYRRAPLLALLLVVGLVLAGCGSNLDPEEVRGTDGAAGDDGGTAGDGGTGGGSTAAGGDAPGAAGGGSAVDGGSSGTGDGGGTDGAGGTTGEAPAAGSDNSATGSGPQGSCRGFRNQTGITDSTITLANASDISGPVPGLFEAAQQGTQAFISYYNATTKLCGRTLELMRLDSRADASADQQAYAKACDGAFAVVGSTSSFDAGGAATAQSCGIPDLRGFTVTPERQACRTCFAAYAVASDKIAASLPQYWLEQEPGASRHVGVFYTDVAAAEVNAKSFAAGFEKAGMNVDVVQGIGVSDFNYAPYVQQMKDEGVEFVQFFGPYQFAIRLQNAMKQQGYEPDVYLEDPTIYDAKYVDEANGVGDGSYVYSPIALFDDTAVQEMALYRAWLEQVAPGADPNYYGLFAWSATRLFVEEATALGGRLTRASLVAAVRKVKGWDGNGLHAPMAVGAKTTSPCVKIIQLDGSTWRQRSPGRYLCGGIISTGVGG